MMSIYSIGVIRITYGYYSNYFKRMELHREEYVFGLRIIIH